MLIHTPFFLTFKTLSVIQRVDIDPMNRIDGAVWRRYLGVKIRESILSQVWIKEGGRNTWILVLVHNKFKEMGLIPSEKETAASTCIDGTEDRYHLSGPFGKRITNFLFDDGWIIRSGSGMLV